MADKNTIELIKALKERTGAGMMDCKKALEESGNDIEKAVDWLREKGIAKQAKRANRTAAEGLALTKTCASCGKTAIVEVNCETDFVSASDKFKGLVDNVLTILLKNEPASLEEARELTANDFGDAGVAVGEKLELRRFAVIHPTEGGCLGTYIHMGGKIAVVVALEKNDPELANGVAMHIAANAPAYVDLESVPAADREREKAIAVAEVADDPKLVNKPENVKAGIVERKVDKQLSLSCLTLQAYLLSPEGKTVGEVLKASGNKVLSFTRFFVGEGIAKAAEEENN
ncbi:MAG: translation elongation factor Ts [Bacilli bacterium]|nr:translation elongation factor Ts [Bacilli bacterium]